ncbi:MAG: hypothetical protein F6K19_50750, partial [Cyanothece sp. SIO1E1]|nr:hypothetical protein [Cyanothece sp. SIO1E1]
MAVVDLAIQAPAHNSVFAGSTQANVRLAGQVVSPSANPLYFKWYSSLHLPPESDPTNTALNQDGDNPLDFVTPLAVGSHILTFTAKDQR